MIGVKPVRLLLLLFYLSLSSFSNALELDYKGYLESYTAVLANDDVEWLAIHQGLRLETTLREDQAELTMRLHALYDSLNSQSTVLACREAYVDYLEDAWDVRLGRQIIIWGKADGLIITDVISPKDQSAFMKREFDDMRLAVDAVKLQLHMDAFRIEGVWIPLFVPTKLPEPGSLWYYQMDAPDSVLLSLTEAIVPESTMLNSEFGFRLAVNSSWLDLSLYWYDGWYDDYVVSRQVSQSGSTLQLTMEPKYHRAHMIGLDAAKPMGEFVWRLESGLFINKPFIGEAIHDEQLYRHHEIKSLIGLDWSPGDDWSITGQVYNNYVIDYDQALDVNEQDWAITLTISKKLLDQLLELSASAYSTMDFDEGYAQMEADYALTDGLHIALGATILYGQTGYMAAIANNDNGWMHVKYSF